MLVAAAVRGLMVGEAGRSRKQQAHFGRRDPMPPDTTWPWLWTGAVCGNVIWGCSVHLSSLGFLISKMGMSSCVVSCAMPWRCEALLSLQYCVCKL